VLIPDLARRGKAAGAWRGQRPVLEILPVNLPHTLAVLNEHLSCHCHVWEAQ
jgi:hypothetical protein